MIFLSDFEGYFSFFMVIGQMVFLGRGCDEVREEAVLLECRNSELFAGWVQGVGVWGFGGLVVGCWGGGVEIGVGIGTGGLGGVEFGLGVGAGAGGRIRGRYGTKHYHT